MEILKKESDPRSKFELFQRLNTGGVNLEPQEIRNASMLMIDKDFYKWLKRLSENTDFIHTISQTDPAAKMQKPMELCLRLLAYKYVKYDGKKDANEYIDSSMISLITRDFNKDIISKDFEDTFSILNRSLGNNVFKKFSKDRFLGAFSLSAFEAIGYGVFENIDEIRKLTTYDPSSAIKSVWSNQTFQKYSGSGVRATQRLAKLLPLGAKLFQP